MGLVLAYSVGLRCQGVSVSGWRLVVAGVAGQVVKATLATGVFAALLAALPVVLLAMVVIR